MEGVVFIFTTVPVYFKAIYYHIHLLQYQRPSPTTIILRPPTIEERSGIELSQVRVGVG